MYLPLGTCHSVQQLVVSTLSSTLMYMMALNTTLKLKLCTFHPVHAVCNPCAEYCRLPSTVLQEIFADPNFRKNPVSPPEEIFTVLIFAFSASVSY